MMISLEINDFSPTLREKEFLCENEKIKVATIGPGSYLVHGILETGNPDSHILVGRYSSLGHRLLFCMGLNHDGRMVSTYPFDDLKFNDNRISNHYYSTNHYQIIIGNDVWIGCDVTILGGVRIGNGAIVGAGAVVAKDVPPYSVVVGNPARVVKYRFSQDICRKLQTIKWWYWPENKIKSSLDEMKNPERFVARYYANSIIENNEISIQITKLKYSGYVLYLFVADIGMRRPLWKKIVHQFINLARNDDHVILLLAGVNTESVEEKWIKKEMLNAKLDDTWRLVVFDDIETILYLVRNVDFYITTREDISSRCIDYAEGYGVRILSGLDYDVFNCGYDGEMNVCI